jgi:hypothetical protein
MKKPIKNLATNLTYTLEVLSYTLAVSLNTLASHTLKKLVRYLFKSFKLFHHEETNKESCHKFNLYSRSFKLYSRSFFKYFT